MKISAQLLYSVQIGSYPNIHQFVLYNFILKNRKIEKKKKNNFPQQIQSDQIANES